MGVHMPNNNPVSVSSVAKALNLVDFIVQGPHEGLSLSEIVREVRGSKSATYATLRTLVDHGYLRLEWRSSG
jgi:DNA-binding IclR family transcriptional regulator